MARGEEEGAGKSFGGINSAPCFVVLHESKVRMINGYGIILNKYFII